ncbi:MAG: galactose oxidase, partial [Chloroflexi bacterium]|nr:galactose oxidase [Chloroflexota bacterium]
AIGDRLYVAGGFDDANVPQAGMFIYDPRSNTWKEGAKMPTPRGALGLTVSRGLVYAVGGVNQGDTPANEEYDPGSDTWKALAPMPTLRNHFAIASLPGRYFVIGGRQEAAKSNVATFEEYQIETNKWRVRSAMPTPRSGIAATWLGDYLMVFGGEDDKKTYNQAEAWSPLTDTWYSGPAMPTARHGIGAATIASAAYVITGGTTPGGSVSVLNERVSATKTMDKAQ